MNINAQGGKDDMNEPNRKGTQQPGQGGRQGGTDPRQGDPLKRPEQGGFDKNR